MQEKKIAIVKDISNIKDGTVIAYYVKEKRDKLHKLYGKKTFYKKQIVLDSNKFNDLQVNDKIYFLYGKKKSKKKIGFIESKV